MLLSFRSAQRYSLAASRIAPAAIVLLMSGTFARVAIAQSQLSAIVIPTGGDPVALAVADLNHDGKLDIVAANPDAGTVTVLLGDGKGHFHPARGSPFPAGHLPADIGVGDFNGDGFPDLLIANHQTPYVTLLLGDGTGGFHPAPHSPFPINSKPHPHGVAVGHFCGDAKPLDAVIDSWASDQVELLIGDGKGDLSDGPMFPAGPGSDMPLRSADLNRDGAPDIVMPDTAIGRWNRNTVSVLLGDGKCGFRPAPGSPFPAGAVPWSVALGDMNGDGIPDIVLIPYGAQVRNPQEIAATVLLGDGKGGFHPMPGSPFSLPGCADPLRVAAGTLGPGLPAFAVTCMHSSSVLLFLGDKSGVFRRQSIDVPSGQKGREPDDRGILFADLLGKGADQLIVSNGSAGSITLLVRK